MNNKEIMYLGIKEAQKTMRKNIGGPFGAAIIDAEGKVIAVASNTVLGSHDATAHAEVNAIRKASRKLKTHDLSGCVLYATGYPCPMCLSAIIWSNIKTVYFGCTPQDADNIGFRDDFIYKFIDNGCDDVSVMDLKPLDRDNCLKLFEEYSKTKKTLY